MDKMIVYHWSKKSDLTVTLPEFAGTGVRGAERDRKQIKGTFFGLPGYREPAVQNNSVQYWAEIGSAKVYSLGSDPLGLIHTAQLSDCPRYRFEQLVIENGFIGYTAQDVVKVFVPVAVAKFSTTF